MKKFSFISFPAQVPNVAASVRETIPGMTESLLLPSRLEDMEKDWSMGEDLAQGVEVRLALPVTPFSLPPSPSCKARAPRGEVRAAPGPPAPRGGGRRKTRRCSA